MSVKSYDYDPKRLRDFRDRYAAAPDLKAEDWSLIENLDLVLTRLERKEVSNFRRVARSIIKEDEVQKIGVSTFRSKISGDDSRSLPPISEKDKADYRERAEKAGLEKIRYSVVYKTGNDTDADSWRTSEEGFKTEDLAKNYLHRQLNRFPSFTFRIIQNTDKLIRTVHPLLGEK